MSESFGAVLRELREDREISQKTLASRCGWNHAHISRTESDERAPTVGGIRKLARALNLTEHERGRLLHAAGLAAPPPPPRFTSMLVDAYEARLLARDLERQMPGNVFSRCVKASVPVEAVGPIRPVFTSLVNAATWERLFEKRFGRQAA